MLRHPFFMAGERLGRRDVRVITPLHLQRFAKSVVEGKSALGGKHVGAFNPTFLLAPPDVS